MTDNPYLIAAAILWFLAVISAAAALARHCDAKRAERKRSGL